MPARIVRPPRTSGLPAARATLASRLASSKPAPRAPAGASGRCGFCGREGGVIIRMVRNFFDVLDVADDVGLIQYENRATLDTQIFDQCPVGFPERAAPMIRQHLDP